MVTTTYEVYQPTVSGPERIMTGSALSRHRTPEAAQRAIRCANRRLQRQPGQANSWLDYHVRARDGATGHARALTPSEQDQLAQLDFDDFRALERPGRRTAR